jgi:two-component system invasion response regulator UvrY
MLYSAIRHVHSGRKYITPTMAEQLATDVAGNREGQPHDALSNREYEVLVQIGSGRTVDEIARQLGVKPKTVRSYRSRIVEKTQLKTTAEIIFYTISSGLVSDVKAADTAAEKRRNPAPRARQRGGKPAGGATTAKRG